MIKSEKSTARSTKSANEYAGTSALQVGEVTVVGRRNRVKETWTMSEVGTLKEACLKVKRGRLLDLIARNVMGHEAMVVRILAEASMVTGLRFVALWHDLHALRRRRQMTMLGWVEGWGLVTILGRRRRITALRSNLCS